MRAGSTLTASPITRRQFFVWLILLSLSALLAGAGMTYWLLAHYTAHLPLQNQTLNVAMPPDLPVRVDVINAGAADVATDPAPSESGIPVRLNETLNLKVSFDSMVPLRMEVRYHGEIPVKTTVPLNTTVSTRVLGVPLNLPVQGEIPLELKLPVDLKIPIDQPVRLRFTAPLSAQIDQVVHIPLRARLDARIQFADPIIPITVREAELGLPLNALSLSGPPLFGDAIVTLGPIAASTTDKNLPSVQGKN